MDAITHRLDVRDLPGARKLFDAAVQGRPEAVGALVQQLAATVAVPPGTVVWGFGIDIWANPHRHGHAWRCGDCPWTGSGYTTDPAARAGAEQHVAQHHPDGPTVVVDYYGDAYWEAVAAE